MQKMMLEFPPKGFFVAEMPQLHNIYLGGGFKHFLFSPLPGEDSHFD